LIVSVVSKCSCQCKPWGYYSKPSSLKSAFS
jgi:hypothetical protein